MEKKEIKTSKEVPELEDSNQSAMEEETTTGTTSAAEDKSSDFPDDDKNSPWGEEGPEAEIADLKDKLLRALAENENTIRRAKREREDTAKYATANFARDMLTVSDNLGRAIEAIPESLQTADDTIKAFLEGINLTSRELLGLLERHGIKKISPLGEKFDHDQHEALFEIPTSDEEPGTVVQVIEDGFMIYDRLLRPAKVGVSKADLIEKSPEDEEKNE
ncbi:MAG: nucleotide exchange factor GrpE [Rhodospirillaceae bacterium]|nr:nucleotide exchange factor GrpE [Rhodospirillaceae bacterium]